MMEKYIIEGASGKSTIVIDDSFGKIHSYIPERNVFIITDKNVAFHHEKSFPAAPVYRVEPGETSKELESLSLIYQWLLELGADRNSFILAIGGGVVCDLAGFVASTFMRGIRFGFVATSLLAQVDASVGGKNGVNLKGYKNIIGTFTQPEFVICDTGLLNTLPDEEYRNGLAEIIKHALIRDAHKFTFLEKNKDLVNARDRSTIDYLVSKSIQIKAAVVQADEREQGERRVLNFGHTWGHAIEKVSKIPHGQAVSIGMVFATNFSISRGMLPESEGERIESLLTNYGLPVNAEIDNKRVFDVMLRDKKKQNQIMHFVLLEEIGKAVVKEISIDELRKFAL